MLHYRIVGKLGAGGMGEVYAADDVKLGRRVALKVLPPEMAADEERLERFRREARIVAGLNHPNVVTLYSVEEAEGVHFLTMELVEGKTLDAVTPLSGMEPEKVSEIATALVDALGVAHRQGVIHRDLKPTNVMVSGEGRVKVLDFGLAKLQRSVAPRTGNGSSEILATDAGRVLGTVAYMSPEQARGEELDARTDLFSLGVILYELVTGTRPFPGGSSAEVLGALLERQPIPPSRINPQLSPQLERVISRCLEKERQNRYSSDRELRADLERLQKGSSPPRDLRWPLRLAAGLAVLVAAGIVATRVGWSPGRESVAVLEPATATTTAKATAPEPLSIAVLPFADLSPEQDREYFSAGLAEELRHVLAQSPDLRVSGRISSSRFQEATGEDLEAIREKLNVATVLEGSVRTDGKRIRIATQLVKTADGFQLWSASFDRELEDIFAVQEEIARSVVRELEGQLEGEELGAAHSRRGNAEAYRAYLQGRYFADRRGKENLQRAIGYYEEALAIDPGYALAWAGLAEVYWAMTGQANLPVGEGYEKARQAAERALQLDDTVAEAWVALGDVRVQDWDWRGADEAFQRAFELAPSNPTVLNGAARMAVVLGRFDRAIALSRRAVEIDPLMVVPYRQLGIHYYLAGRPEEAKRAYEKALELSPGYRAVHRLLGQVYLTQGRPEAALAEMERETAPFYRLYGLALAYHAVGRQEEADAALSKLIETYSESAAFQIAQVYAFRGDNDGAFGWLERARRQRDAGLSQHWEPNFDGLRDDPRWKPFLDTLGLEE